jgi:hypothetical protein
MNVYFMALFASYVVLLSQGSRLSIATDLYLQQINIKANELETE